MNRTKIEWADYTWNPVTGCSRGCPHCYAWRMAKRLRGRYGYPADRPFSVTFHPNRLSEPRWVKKPSRIFVCSMGELFDPASRYGWIGLIFAEIKRNPQHTFQILTQCAEVLPQFDFPVNVWLGVTVKRGSELKRMVDLTLADARVRFVSFEPLLDPVDGLRNFPGTLKNIDWIIIGAKTGPKPFVPPREWVQGIMDHARALGIPVFLKDNLKWPSKIQEFPEGDREIQGVHTPRGKKET